MAYNQASDVTNILKTENYDGTADLTSAQITAWIARADARTDNALAEHFTVPFNAYGDTPATPGVIRDIALAYALAACYYQLADKGGNGVLRDWARAKEEDAAGMIADLIGVPGQMRPETEASETITLQGATRQSWEPDQYEGFIADGSANPMTAHQSTYQPPNILEESVRVLSTSSSTGYTGAQLAQLRNGVDFRVVYDVDRKKYLFEALVSALQSATTINVTYLWDYRRKLGESRRISMRVLEA